MASLCIALRLTDTFRISVCQRAVSDGQKERERERERWKHRSQKCCYEQISTFSSASIIFRTIFTLSIFIKFFFSIHLPGLPLVYLARDCVKHFICFCSELISISGKYVWCLFLLISAFASNDETFHSTVGRSRSKNISTKMIANIDNIASNHLNNFFSSILFSQHLSFWNVIHRMETRLIHLETSDDAIKQY